MARPSLGVRPLPRSPRRVHALPQIARGAPDAPGPSPSHPAADPPPALDGFTAASAPPGGARRLFPAMLPAPARRPGPATRPAVRDDGHKLIPFAKCSRVVRRSAPPGLSSQSPRLMPQRYGDLFWENLSQKPSPSWMEEQYTPPLQRATGCSQPGLYPPEGLPPPELLCRRKRRRPPLAGMQQGPGGIPARVRAVAYHLEDLRRRQRLINERKNAQWGSSGAASEPLALAHDRGGVPRATQYRGLEEERAAYPQEDGHPLTSGQPQLLWSPWSPLAQGGSCFPRRLGSLASYSAVRASRTLLCKPWGMEVRSEE
ncbi:protein INCA1 [Lontra canadensis]|uniref:protein INCA1 n=1 Tax=Lontra canadensis TaxID=76717 RepID=UPI0013F386BB|nr:protein INCA1 [Lontra canadensis]